MALRGRRHYIRAVRRSLVQSVFVFAAVSTWTSAALAETREYAIEILDGQDSSFEIPFAVPHAGPIVVEAAWSGNRLVSFRIEQPGGIGVASRRSGPSPQRLETWVTEGIVEKGRDWKLTIRALPARGAAAGTLTLRIPDAPEVVAAREAEAAPPPPPPPPPDPITLKRQVPPGASPEVAALVEAVEPLRAAVFPNPEAAVSDPCGWQRDALRWFRQAQDSALAGTAIASEGGIRFALRLAHAIREVDALRRTTNPAIAGPRPSDPTLEREWTSARAVELRPLERELDLLAEQWKRGYAQGLTATSWPARLLACLVACQRHFEERPRVEPEPAANAELAGAEWDRILAAAGALEALRPFGGPPTASRP